MKRLSPANQPPPCTNTHTGRGGEDDNVIGGAYTSWVGRGGGKITTKSGREQFQRGLCVAPSPRTASDVSFLVAYRTHPDRPPSLRRHSTVNSRELVMSEGLPVRSSGFHVSHQRGVTNPDVARKIWGTDCRTEAQRLAKTSGPAMRTLRSVGLVSARDTGTRTQINSKVCIHS